MEHFSENLRRLRLERGWSQQTMAELLHVSPKTISKWETGENRPDIDTVVRLAKCCEVTTDSLLLGADTETVPTDGVPNRFAFLSAHLPMETLTAAAGVPEPVIREILDTGRLPTQSKAHGMEKLMKILIVFSDLLPRFSQNEFLLIQTLCCKLAESEVSPEVIEHFALLEPGVLRAYTAGETALRADAMVRLIITLFMMDAALNREDAFPWD